MKLWTGREGLINGLASLKFPKLATKDEQRSWTASAFSHCTRGSVLMTDIKGNIWEWKLHSPGAKAHKRIFTPHSRPIFSLASVETGEGGDAIISCSMDRQVACCRRSACGNASEGWKFRGYGAHPYCLDQSAGVPTKLAVGCGDNSIRIYNEEASAFGGIMQEKNFIWSGVNAKVLSIYFHPVLEDVLVFLTEDGFVCAYNFTTERLHSVKACSANGKMCEISWRVTMDEERMEGHAWLWSLDCAGCLYQWHKDLLAWDRMDRSHVYKQVSFSNELEGSIVAFLWSACGKYLAVATSGGEVYLYSGDMVSMTMLGRHTCSHSKNICSIGVESIESQARETLLIVLGHQDGKISTVSFERSEGADQFGVRSNQTLDAHKSTVTKIAFSPYCEHFLACSSDSHITIWSYSRLSITCALLLAGHNAGVLSALWSSSSCIYSVSEDQSLRKWRVYLQ